MSRAVIDEPAATLRVEKMNRADISARAFAGAVVGAAGGFVLVWRGAVDDG